MGDDVAPRKDFITSYSIKNYENISFLEVIFNQDKVISKFKELSIPIIGHSRPVIFFLIEIILDLFSGKIKVLPQSNLFFKNCEYKIPVLFA